MNISMNLRELEVLKGELVSNMVYSIKNKSDASRWSVEQTENGYIKVKREKEVLYEKYSDKSLTEKGASNLLKKIKIDYYDGLRKTMHSKSDMNKVETDELHECLFCHSVPKLLSKVSETSMGVAEQRYLRCKCGIIMIFGDVTGSTPRETVDNKIIAEYNNRMPLRKKG